MTKKQNKKTTIPLKISLIMLMLLALFATAVSAQRDTINPKVISVYPANNQKDLPLNISIMATFSEDMDPSTINANTFIVTQRATPEFGNYRATEVEGTVKYSQAGRTAIFTPKEILSPNQIYGNVWTVNIKDTVRDLAGNPLSRNFRWSFTTGRSQFNTGATTAQLDQSSPNGGSEVSPPLPAPVEVAPVATTTASTFPWAWVIGAIVLLLLIGLLVAYLMTKSGTKKEEEIVSTEPSPFGDVHPVIDLEGIGPVYSKELHKIGINNTKELWEADAAKVARETGAPLASVKSWQNMAELASINDIGPQYAELLDRSGIHSIAQLKKADPDKLLSLIKKKQDSLKVNILGNHPGQATVKHWIHEAKDHRFRGHGFHGA